MDEFLSQIVERVSEQTGVKPEKLDASTRLLQDIGMDGDDAVEFFEDFEERYGVDLSPLYANWGRHFGPEGFGTPKTFVVLLILMFAPVSLLLFGVSPIWGWAVELAGVVIWNLAVRKWAPKDETLTVTVGDLVLAAKSKRWPLVYNTP
ncbi:DUF1493 family protein [Sphingomonas sp. HDW15A]|uniref:acyl carrier protein n=1 Tax=Sphingomonas sp. HDW15A TaxID=2714942 RepID=UPI00140D704D|nr:DUF1493 family protein [Sphingomonas sp. HDW15A]QIK95895.1 DUF1493 family protein [Sphingomonas sp. HDW15A]